MNKYSEVALSFVQGRVLQATVIAFASGNVRTFFIWKQLKQSDVGEDISFSNRLFCLLFILLLCLFFYFVFWFF